MELSFLLCMCISIGITLNFRHVECSASLEVTFVEYVNPNGRDWDNDVCDYLFNTQCDNLFDICIDRASGTEDIGQCSYASYNTGEFANQNTIAFSDSMHGVPNPMVVTLSSWENVLLKVRVRDDDRSHSPHDLVDLHYYQYTGVPGSNNSFNTATTQAIIGVRTNSAATSLTVRFRVKCNSHYYGGDCTNFCQYTDNNRGHYKCSATGTKQCLQGWENVNSNCKVRSDDCINHACQHGATCVDGVRSYTCGCSPGYTGERCETDYNECSSSPCLHNGTCTDLVNGFSCACLPTYPNTLSDDCSIHTCDHEDPCQNGATCYGNGKCLCPPNYTGLRCEFTFCQRNCVVCQNGGTCTGSACICPPGVYGERCEVDICDHITCYNGGSCINGTCLCTDGYSGNYCHEIRDHCIPSPCLNSGHCINSFTNYSCLCLNEYTGFRCDTEIPKPTTPKPEKPVTNDNNVPKDNANVIVSEKQNGIAPPVANTIYKSDHPSPMLMAMIICMVLLLLIIIVLMFILCKDRILRKRKEILEDRERERRMANFENPVYTLDNSRQHACDNTYDEARYMQTMTENDTNSARYAELTGQGVASGGKTIEPMYDYPRNGHDPIYDQPGRPRPLTELQEPPPYSPPLDPNYANGGPLGTAAVSMSELKARLENDHQYEDLETLKKRTDDGDKKMEK